MRLINLLCISIILSGCTIKQTGEIFDPMALIALKLETTLQDNTDPTNIPRTINEDGSLKTVGVYDWTSGFFAGNLWYMYGLTNDEKWKDAAIRWTDTLDTIQYWSGNHDVGFMINCSYGNGLRLSGLEQYESVLIQTSESLIKRYNKKVHAIKSWDRHTEWFYPVIIDNMMNLEILFEASRLSGNNKYHSIALQHAETSMKNHYRNDFSCYHVVNYDTITGGVLDKATNQGFTDESSWARGQAWGLYGYVICFRYTQDAKFLSFAENIADFILNHKSMPEDMIPIWDYNVVDSGFIPEWNYNPADYDQIPRDVSAAAITASALIELSTFSSKKKEYLEAADKIIFSLLSPENLAIHGNNKYFILNHSVGSLPHGREINVPLIYADYYFLEAMYRRKKLKHGETI